MLAVALTWDFAARWQEGIGLVRSIGAHPTEHPVRVAARIEASLAYLGQLVGDMEASRESAVRAIDLAERAGDDWTLRLALATRAFIAHFLDEPAPERWAERSLSLARAGKDPNVTPSRCAVSLGQVTIESPPRPSQAVLRGSRRACPRGRRSPVPGVRRLLPQLDSTRERRYGDAEALRSARLHAGFGDPWTRAQVTRVLGWALAGRRANHEAARLIGAGDIEHERLRIVQDKVETNQHSAALARIEAAIGAPALDEALRAGRQLQIGEAVELALTLFPPEPAQSV